MADGTAWRTVLGAFSALGVGALGVAVVPPLLVPGEPALDAQVAELPDVATPIELALAVPVATLPADVASAGGPDGPEDAVPQAGSASPATAATGDQGAEATEEPRADLQPGPALQEDLASDPLTPSFDTVRVDPDGTGLVAGRAEPGAAVAILADETVAAEVTADADGRFVAFFALGPSSGPRVLLLRDGAGAESDETVIVAPNASQGESASLGPDMAAAFGPTAAAPTDQPVGPAAGQGLTPPRAPQLTAPDSSSVEPEVYGDPASPPSADRGADPTAPAAAPADSPAEAGPAPEVATIAPQLPGPVGAPLSSQEAVLLSDADGVRVVQPALAPGASPEVLATVALDAIAYDGSGEVVLSGRATDRGAVRLYLDNAPVADASIAPDGTWSVPLTAAEPGRYTLRVDQLDASGAVVSRIETPFQREERSSLAAALAEARRMSNGIALRTVQPGNTLWAIARERYGEPLLYLRVFEANRDRIRNPDLIYPGQVFVLPSLEQP